MGFLGDAVGKAKDFAQKNPDKVNAGMDKAKDTISDKTGGKYDKQVDAGAEKLEGFLGADEGGQGQQGGGQQQAQGQQGGQGQGGQGQGGQGQGQQGQ